MYDLVIIGGGINGCGCAADAALRGLSVLLCEQDDLAAHTSSQSTQLIHGGLRYLAYGDLRLVKKALTEQYILRTVAPHLIRLLPLVLACQPNGRPAWILKIGLWIYDFLSPTNTKPHSIRIDRDKDLTYFAPLCETLAHGFLFYDCITQDARLTLANALQAKEHGADILTQTALTNAKVQDGAWDLTLKPKSTAAFSVRAKAIINATGPWVTLLNQQLNLPVKYPLIWNKGSHIVIPKQYEGEQAYVLQNDDKRLIFVIPYYGYTMVGTTESLFDGPLQEISIAPEEIDYLITLVNQYFKTSVSKTDIIHAWSGVRSLIAKPGKSASELSRDYMYDKSTHPATAITIYGGKITTYRQLAVDVIDELRPLFPHMPASNTHTMTLPGANIDMAYMRSQYTWLNEATLQHYMNTYAGRMDLVLAGCTNQDELGIAFSDTLYQAEVDYLMREEWAKNPEDILWRRTKHGLTISVTGIDALKAYMKLSLNQLKSP